MLRHCANGFGALALSALSQDRGYGALKRGLSMAPQQPHAKRRAKNVIFLYMDGGPAQMDTFDPKPELARWVEDVSRWDFKMIAPAHFAAAPGTAGHLIE